MFASLLFFLEFRISCVAFLLLVENIVRRFSYQWGISCIVCCNTGKYRTAVIYWSMSNFIRLSHFPSMSNTVHLIFFSVENIVRLLSS